MAKMTKKQADEVIKKMEEIYYDFKRQLNHLKLERKEITVKFVKEFEEEKMKELRDSIDKLYE